MRDAWQKINPVDRIFVKTSSEKRETSHPQNHQSHLNSFNPGYTGTSPKHHPKQMDATECERCDKSLTNPRCTDCGRQVAEEDFAKIDDGELTCADCCGNDGETEFTMIDAEWLSQQTCTCLENLAPCETCEDCGKYVAFTCAVCESKDAYKAYIDPNAYCGYCMHCTMAFMWRIDTSAMTYLGKCNKGQTGDASEKFCHRAPDWPHCREQTEEDWEEETRARAAVQEAKKEAQAAIQEAKEAHCALAKQTIPLAAQTAKLNPNATEFVPTWT